MKQRQLLCQGCHQEIIQLIPGFIHKVECWIQDNIQEFHSKFNIIYNSIYYIVRFITF